MRSPASRSGSTSSQRSRIAELERQARTLQQENAGLRVEMTKLYDPAELERLARECLGMVARGEIAFVTASPAREAELSDC